ncbi:GroES-like protein [Tothia fuscella]|uniref:GroES-like protein n=1 Tax=Tothia fuscella TaxID=1048955 RepID=A0A9P4U0M4_9PEZI|nr:GroES-like protein [Tothia fuscella]
MFSAQDPMSFLRIKASVLHGAKDLRVESRTIRAPNPGELQIAIQSTGLCGSDLHYYNHFRNGDIQCLEPLTLGHESAGVVVDVGSAVNEPQGKGKRKAESSQNGEEGWKIGDKVALEVGLPCGICDLCLSERYNICPDLKFRSSAKGYPHAQGTLQERINHPKEWCHKLPSSLPPEIGALLEPLGVAIHASRRAALKEGATILIFGAGAVGLLVAAVMKVERTAAKIVIADIDAGRVDFAIENGFADQGYIVKKKTSQDITKELENAKSTAEEIGDLVGSGSKNNATLVDAVFECTGVPSSLQSAFYVCLSLYSFAFDADQIKQATRPGGKIMLIGMGTPIQTLPISAAALREVDIIGVFRYANTYPKGIELLARMLATENSTTISMKKMPDIRKLITHRFQGFDRIEDAFKMAGKTVDGDGNLVIKVVTDFNGLMVGEGAKL